MKKIQYTFFFILFFFVTNAQVTKLKGKVIDYKTGKPLEYVNIQLRRMGTITDQTGKFTFSIPEKYNDKDLWISYMGYKEKRMHISDIINKDIIIKLEKDNIILSDVNVMPDSTILTLLRKAYNNIPKNYPYYPTKLKGFNRETLKDSINQYLYFSEAVIEMNKSSYKYSSDYGQVKILKSMTNEFIGLDSLHIRFYGSPFSANESDYVKKRNSFINPKKFKQYNYSFLGQTKYSGKNVYMVAFSSKKNTIDDYLSGVMYIDKTSLAYIAFDIKNATEISKKQNIHKPKQIDEYITNVKYVKYKDKWHLKSAIRQRSMFFKAKKICINVIYVTTNIETDSVKHIPLNDRIAYTDIFSEKTKEYYDEDYWDEYNVLVKDSILKKQMNTLFDTINSKKILKKESIYKTRKAKQKKLNKILYCLSKMRMKMGVTYASVHSKGGQYSLAFKNINLKENLKSFEYIPCINLQMSYSLNNTWSLDFATSNSISNKLSMDMIDIGASCNFLLNKYRKPILLELSCAYSFQNYYQKFSTYENNNKFKMGGKTIDANEIKFGIGNSSNGLKPKIGLKAQLYTKLWLNLSVDYLLPLYSEDRLYVAEESGFFLFRKTANTNLSNKEVNMHYNDVKTMSSPNKFDNYSISLGLIYDL